MKRHSLLPLIAATLIALAPATPAFAAEKGNLESRLSRALKLFPEADTDKDGVLSMEEALKYVEAHPELKVFLAGKANNEGSPVRVSSAPGAAPLASDAALSPGPRLFVCAHSFMIYTAQMLPPMARAAGIAPRDAGRQMIGGSRVLQHWEVPDEQNRAKTALREGKVDVLTVSPHMLLPDEGIDNFTKLGLAANPKLRVLVQASWPARDGDAANDFTNEKRDSSTVESLHKMRDGHHVWVAALEKQVRALNDSVGHEAVFIIPASDAVFALRERVLAGTAPGVAKQSDLFRDPLGHPQPPLAVLVGYCHFASIYGRSPVGLPVPAELKSHPQAEALNKLLQQLAWEAVTHYPMSGVKP